LRCRWSCRFRSSFGSFFLSDQKNEPQKITTGTTSLRSGRSHQTGTSSLRSRRRLSALRLALHLRRRTNQTRPLRGLRHGFVLIFGSDSALKTTNRARPGRTTTESTTTTPCQNLEHGQTYKCSSKRSPKPRTPSPFRPLTHSPFLQSREGSCTFSLQDRHRTFILSSLHIFNQQLALGDVRRSDGSGGAASHSRSARGLAKTTGGEMLPAKASKQSDSLSADAYLRGRALEHFSGA